MLSTTMAVLLGHLFFLKKIAGQWDQDLGRKLISNLERS